MSGSHFGQADTVDERAKAATRKLPGPFILMVVYEVVSNTGMQSRMIIVLNPGFLVRVSIQTDVAKTDKVFLKNMLPQGYAVTRPETRGLYFRVIVLRCTQYLSDQ